MKLSRRDLLKGVAAGAAFGATGLGLRTARARLPVNPVSILLLDFSGGWNVHATFAARTHPDVNPHGIAPARGDMGIMKVSPLIYRDRENVVNTDSAAWGMRVPVFEETAHHFSMIGAMRHAESYVLDDHPPSGIYCATGYLDRLDAPGLGTVVARYAPKDRLAPPAVCLSNLIPGWVAFESARASGAWLPHAPVVFSHKALPIGGSGGVGFIETETRLDEAAGARRRGLAAQKVEMLRRYKEAFRRHRSFFLDKAIHTTDPANANERLEEGLLGSGSPTNQQLIDAFGGTFDGDESALALAFRCLEGGSRFVAVSCGFSSFPMTAHDTHTNEQNAWKLYVRDAQIFAGVSFLLEKLGLAKNVLVVGLSEMARCPYAGGGFNGAGGTDHGRTGIQSPKGLYGSNRQSVLLAHGPIRPGREAYPAESELGDPAGAPCITAELLAFIADCAGVEREDHPWNVSPEGAPLDAEALARVLIA